MFVLGLDQYLLGLLDVLAKGAEEVNPVQQFSLTLQDLISLSFIVHSFI